MPARKRMPPITLEGVRIIFRNFSGEEGRFNAKGDRNFNVLIDDELAESMIADGWNIKYLKPREEEDKPQARLEVAVEYRKGRPPRVMMITSRGKTLLDESMVNVLDYAEIENVDMIIRPSVWEVNGRSGVKAYLQSIYVTIVEDDLEKKYLDVPDSAQNSIVMTEDEKNAPF